MVELAAGRSAAAAREAMAMKKKLVMSRSSNKKPEKDGRATKKQSREAESPSYRLALKSIFSCRNSGQQQHRAPLETAGKRRPSVSGSSCERKPPQSEELPLESSKQLQLQRGGSSSSSSGGSFRLRRLSGCYECHMVVDPVSGGGSSSSMRATTCPDCGQIFVRQETLQLHQSITHAVCELGADDTSRNIIEIIFQSSWVKKQRCKVERILKVRNTPRTLAAFEEYRDAVKAKAARQITKHPAARCSADGNELLRFHCASLACALGLNGATHLCDGDGGGCGACAIIRDGFVIRNRNAAGVWTMATSGRAHDDAVEYLEEEEEERSRAMLVCRVIAGRVKRRRRQPRIINEEEEGSAAAQHEQHDGVDDDDLQEFESVAGSAPGVYSNLEELMVFNPRAILPCFVVVYKA
ncbi:uncharacterized protein LOC120642203 isoform X2 [Panicum virgatum]|uniref:uncharacterized protein LOC120642203 isoform X2 n=1 Tax=Panicum virgatum TaxID=38727 RepID=UPI0019D60EFF|nr:uncharacterized protein LOC120642203 isoform X2 [Panicum virgatum]